MSVLKLVRPLPIASANGNQFVNFARLTSPDPKEAAYLPSASSQAALQIDLGAVQSIDTVFVGYVSDNANGSLLVSGSADGSSNVFSATVLMAPGDGGLIGAPQHLLYNLPAAQSVRYITVSAPSGVTLPAGYTVGIVAAGLSFQAIWGHEMGAGRPIEDTSDIERLFGGGFSIDAGAILGGYQWQFGDLQDSERAALYRLARQLGNSRTTLVVEDPDFTAGLNERIHWGLLKIDTYERINPANWRWAFTIRDWG